MKEKKPLRFLLIYVLSGVAFFALTMPFHRILSVFTVSEVRPSAVLYPLLGISFGWPSALGIMTANLISDAVNGYSFAVLAEGVIPQLLYALIPYYLWKLLMRGEDHRHRLDSVGRVLKFVLVCLAFTVVSGFGVGTIVYVNFGTDLWKDFWLASFFVMLNNFNISVVLGCPLMIVSNQIISRRSGTERILTRNEKIIIATAVVQIVTLVVLIVSVYSGQKTIGTYDIWNTVYLLALLTNNVIMLLSLLCMALCEKSARRAASREDAAKRL